MISERTRELARRAAAELRVHGQNDRAEAIEALVEATREESISTLDFLTTTRAGELLGVTGQTIKNWVCDGHLAGYRVGGHIVIPREAVEAYVRRARGSPDLEELSDDEAATLVAEGRSPSA
jgi:excisionase family DNA binding protein